MTAILEGPYWRTLLLVLVGRAVLLVKGSSHFWTMEALRRTNRRGEDVLSETLQQLHFIVKVIVHGWPRDCEEGATGDVQGSSRLTAGKCMSSHVLTLVQ